MYGNSIVSSSGQHRVVVDTNLVVSSFLSQTGAPRAVIQAMRDRRFVPIATEVILKEYAEVLGRPIFASKYDVDVAEVAGLLQLVRDLGIILPEVSESPLRVRDDLDQKFLDAAQTTDADFLVTGDSDLLDLADDPLLGRLRIVRPREFLNIIEQG
jgi:putative PIN family toxin of toxin-antitoxin system